MFPTSSRSRTVNAAKAYQHESPPTPNTKGADSCYGVKSVSSWGEQSEVDLIMPRTPESQDDAAGDYAYQDKDDEGETSTQTHVEREEGEDGESTPEGGDSLASSSAGLGLGLGITPTQDNILTLSSISPSHSRSNSEKHPSSFAQAISPSRPIHTKPEQRIVPPSPEDTVHPLDHHFEPNPTLDRGAEAAGITGSPSQSTTIASSHGVTPLTLEHITRSFDSPYLPTTSEPSSPASFTSMPSYVASLSSLSRTSSISPMGIHEYDAQRSGSIEDELVLPTLTLPSESLSLHMSLSKWQEDDTQDDDAGLKLALLGSREEVEACLRRLRESEHLVEVSPGVGIVRGGKVVLRLMTSLKTIEQARSKINRSYNTLNGLLHPQLREDTSSQAELRRLVEGYIGRSDWLHGVLVLGEEIDVIDLESIVPTFTFPSHPSSAQETQSASPSDTKTPCIRTQEIEPTPRPSDTDETSGYFAPRAYTPSPPSSNGSSPAQSQAALPPAVQQILNILNDPSGYTNTFIDAFLSWRSTHLRHEHEVRPSSQSMFDIDDALPALGGGGQTMTSSLTSASSGVGTMPTVARAQGGGEWEATLSRRVAQRRESDSIRERERDRSSTSIRGSTSTTATGSGNGGKSAGGRIRRKRSSDKIKKLGDKDREMNEGGNKHPSLFPTYSPASRRNANLKKGGGGVGEKGLGIEELMNKTFVKGVRRWTRGWRGLLVVGLVVAVGCGCGWWISQK
ncbi:uncharacterized protein I303_105770 [Kwoniella dejecticola CBS 10117]|uniref:Uncharacterized protein n=1 Tax=Kwoniella dejecticola CBS 10117 TaxID=1296121 RepID=A0A1A6A0B4_9TREE|nr:uncharacterized protein I303_05792 [Kwoniella dejecticola CBS 10117]OBR83512.1 hypothetical protein I303_05792 [Kwoniella dejecticola CBS 10117]